MRVFVKWPKRVALKSGKEHEPKKLKSSCSFSLACLITFGLCLTHDSVSQNDLSRKFQRSSLSGGMTTLTHTFKKEARKLLISLEAKNLRFDITQVTSTLIGYVELLGFHENWLECSSDIIAQKCIRL